MYIVNWYISSEDERKRKEGGGAKKNPRWISKIFIGVQDVIDVCKSILNYNDI